MTSLDYYLRGAVKDKYYVDKPEIIEALKDNMREAIGEIQLHTVDNVLKNWIDRVGYRKACTFKYKKKFEKIFSSFFFKAFSKKKLFGGPYS